MTKSLRTLTRRAVLCGPLALPFVAAMPAIAGGTDACSMTDIVVEYGRQLNELSAFIEKTEECPGAPGYKVTEALCEKAYARRDVVEAMIRETRATSVEDAIVQIMLVSSSASYIGGCVSDDWAEECERMQKLLYSAVKALEARCRLNRLDVGGDSYMPERLDPFAWEQKAEAA